MSRYAAKKRDPRKRRPRYLHVSTTLVHLTAEQTASGLPEIRVARPGKTYRRAARSEAEESP